MYVMNLLDFDYAVEVIKNVIKEVITKTPTGLLTDSLLLVFCLRLRHIMWKVLIMTWQELWPVIMIAWRCEFSESTSLGQYIQAFLQKVIQSMKQGDSCFYICWVPLFLNPDGMMRTSGQQLCIKSHREP